MSDLLKSGLKFNPHSASDANSSSPQSDISPESASQSMSSALKRMDALFQAGDEKELTAFVNEVIEQHSEEPVVLDSMIRWLLQDDRVFENEDLYLVCSACMKTFRSAVDKTGDKYLVIELNTFLRNKKYNCETQVQEFTNRKQLLAEERSAKEAAIATLEESINKLTSAIEKAQHDKAAASEELEKLAVKAETDFSAVRACATIGFFILSIMLLLDGCNKGGADAFGGFFLAPIGGLIFGVPAGALVGLIVSLASSGMKSKNQSQAESLAKDAMEQAERILTASLSEKSQLVSDMENLQSRTEAIDVEIAQADKGESMVFSRLKQIDFLIGLLF